MRINTIGVINMSGVVLTPYADCRSVIIARRLYCFVTHNVVNNLRIPVVFFVVNVTFDGHRRITDCTEKKVWFR